MKVAELESFREKRRNIVDKLILTGSHSLLKVKNLLFLFINCNLRLCMEEVKIKLVK